LTLGILTDVSFKAPLVGALFFKILL
jgi:hypothetical protein